MIFRTPIYLLIFISYIIFMSSHSSLGVNWTDWHFHRIFNAVEFLKINGYFSSNFFTIWTKCEGCDLSIENWKDKIYASRHYFNLIPYIFINHFGGYDSLLYFGHLFDNPITVLP